MNTLSRCSLKSKTTGRLNINDKEQHICVTLNKGCLKLVNKTLYNIFDRQWHERNDSGHNLHRRKSIKSSEDENLELKIITFQGNYSTSQQASIQASQKTQLNCENHKTSDDPGEALRPSCRSARWGEAQRNFTTNTTHCTDQGWTYGHAGYLLQSLCLWCWQRNSRPRWTPPYHWPNTSSLDAWEKWAVSARTGPGFNPAPNTSLYHHDITAPCMKGRDGCSTPSTHPITSCRC